MNAQQGSRRGEQGESAERHVAQSEVTDEDLAEYRRYLGNPALTVDEVAMMKAMNL